MGFFVGMLLTFVWWIWRTTPKCVTERISKCFEQKTTAKLSRKRIKVPFWLSGQKYNILVKRPRKNFLMFSNIFCDGKDRTLRVIKYLGPDNNFFGSDVTPRDLGYREMEFQVIVPFEKNFFFSEDDVITL